MALTFAPAHFVCCEAAEASPQVGFPVSDLIFLHKITSGIVHEPQNAIWIFIVVRKSPTFCWKQSVLQSYSDANASEPNPNASFKNTRYVFTTDYKIMQMLTLRHYT